MNVNEIQPGLRVVVTELQDTKGFLVVKGQMDNRRLGPGVIKGYVGGHGGDVWWVEHDDGAVAPYGFTELEKAPT